MEEHKQFIKDVIKSCTNTDHLQSAHKMISNSLKWFPHEPDHKKQSFIQLLEHEINLKRIDLL